MEISLGLDLKGGMNVILEVSVPDVIRALADNKPDENFNKALNEAAKQAVNSQDDIITLFVREYQKTAPGAKLSELQKIGKSWLMLKLCLCVSQGIPLWDKCIMEIQKN